MLGQLVDNLDTRKIGRQRLALAAALEGSNDFFIDLFGRGFWCDVEQRLRLVEQGQLRGIRIDGLLGFTTK